MGNKIDKTQAAVSMMAQEDVVRKFSDTQSEAGLRFVTVVCVNLVGRGFFLCFWQISCAEVNKLGFLQGFCFSVAHAQACRWDELGALAPIRQFLGGLIESALRLFGPAGPPRNLHLSNQAARLLSQIHDFLKNKSFLHGSRWQSEIICQNTPSG